MTVDEVLRCSECAAPVKEGQERCDYCGYWFKPKPIEEIAQEAEVEQKSYSQISGSGAGFLESAIGLIIILFVIATLLPAIANFTTGITTAHSGFTPNPNITSNGSNPGGLPVWFFIFIMLVLAIVIGAYASKRI